MYTAFKGTSARCNLNNNFVPLSKELKTFHGVTAVRDKNSFHYLPWDFSMCYVIK